MTIAGQQVRAQELLRQHFLNIFLSGPFLTIAVVLFAISTMISWSSGLQSRMYVFGKSKISDLTIKYLLAIHRCWCCRRHVCRLDISDAMILALVFPNMIGLFFLYPKVKEELNRYLSAIGTVK